MRSGGARGEVKPGGCPAGAAFGRSPDGNAFEGAESGICADPRAFVPQRALRSSSGEAKGQLSSAAPQPGTAGKTELSREKRSAALPGFYPL